MWERFSYYGMRGLLIFYLTQHFMFDDTFANGQYGAYTSLVYLLPLIGGFVADRYLGARKAVAFGALLLVAGHFTMAIEGPAARQFLLYQGQRYSLVSEGRGEESSVAIIAGDRLLHFAPAPDGGIDISGASAGGVLPAHIPAGAYRTV